MAMKLHERYILCAPLVQLNIIVIRSRTESAEDECSLCRSLFCGLASPPISGLKRVSAPHLDPFFLYPNVSLPLSSWTHGAPRSASIFPAH